MNNSKYKGNRVFKGQIISKILKYQIIFIIILLFIILLGSYTRPDDYKYKKINNKNKNEYNIYQLISGESRIWPSIINCNIDKHILCYTTKNINLNPILKNILIFIFIQLSAILSLCKNNSIKRIIIYSIIQVWRYIILYIFMNHFSYINKYTDFSDHIVLSVTCICILSTELAIISKNQKLAKLWCYFMCSVFFYMSFFTARFFHTQEETSTGFIIGVLNVIFVDFVIYKIV
eukprot:GHVL01024221.1.p1 GENE.GHVL01024221.1~~GHVL01024221.1.p1  ORF type:complete len:233 (+),score=50.57 GHVL01024221.1:30-728(+)